MSHQVTNKTSLDNGSSYSGGRSTHLITSERRSIAATSRATINSMTTGVVCRLESKYGNLQYPPTLYEHPQTASSKIFRIFTVLLYMIAVSMAAILLAVYYFFLWDPLANQQLQQQLQKQIEMQIQQQHNTHPDRIFQSNVSLSKVLFKDEKQQEFMQNVTVESLPFHSGQQLKQINSSTNKTSSSVVTTDSPPLITTFTNENPIALLLLTSINRTHKSDNKTI